MDHTGASGEPDRRAVLRTIHFFDDSGMERSRESYQVAAGSSSRITASNSSSETVVALYKSNHPRHRDAGFTCRLFLCAGRHNDYGNRSGFGRGEQVVELCRYKQPVRCGSRQLRNRDSKSHRPDSAATRRATSNVIADPLRNLSLKVPAHGHISRFMSELFPAITPSFTGVLHVIANFEGSATLAPVSITGLRGRYNSRNEFIVATVTPAVDDAPGTTQFTCPTWSPAADIAPACSRDTFAAGLPETFDSVRPLASLFRSQQDRAGQPERGLKPATTFRPYVDPTVR